MVCFDEHAGVGVPGSMHGLSFPKHSDAEGHGQNLDTQPFVAARQAGSVHRGQA